MFIGVSPPPLDSLILGTSLPMRRLREEIRSVAAHPLRSLLVVGETGVGKELVPRGLQHCLPGNPPLEVFNCPAVPSDHLESELFGTTRHAYPGATDRPGAAERAHEGLLFLDEVSAMPLDHQAKVLRLLESREARRLGSARPFRTFARVVAATNEDLASRVETGAFREDLYHRLVQDGVVKIPPLRERLEDIEVLARAVLSELPGACGLEPAALRALQAYDWPGNVRQLRAVVRCAARLAAGRTLDADTVGEALHRIEIPGIRARRNGEAPEGSRGFHASTDRVRRHLLIEALDRAGGNQTLAGIILGMHRRRDGEGAVPDPEEPGAVSMRSRKLAHRKFRYWWDRLVDERQELARGS